MLTRAAAAAVGQAVTPALLQLLLPVMADEIVIGAASVPDPPFVVEDPSYRKVCRHTAVLRTAFGFPFRSRPPTRLPPLRLPSSRWLLRRRRKRRMRMRILIVARAAGACAEPLLQVSAWRHRACARYLSHRLPARDCRGGGPVCVAAATRQLRHSRRCFAGPAAVDARLASAVGHYERPISDGATSFGETHRTTLHLTARSAQPLQWVV